MGSVCSKPIRNRGIDPETMVDMERWGRTHPGYSIQVPVHLLKCLGDEQPGVADLREQELEDVMHKSWKQTCQKNGVDHFRAAAILLEVAEPVRGVPDPRLVMWILQEEVKRPWRHLREAAVDVQKRLVPDAPGALQCVFEVAGALRRKLSQERRDGPALCWYEECAKPMSAAVKLFTCKGCNTARYCSTASQRNAWPAHQAWCQARSCESPGRKQKATERAATVADQGRKKKVVRFSFA